MYIIFSDEENIQGLYGSFFWMWQKIEMYFIISDGEYCYSADLPLFSDEDVFKV